MAARTVGLLWLLGSAAAAAAAPGIVLEIGGTAGLGFDGHCVLERAGETRTVSVRGRVPARRTFAADAADCRLRPARHGRLEVALRAGDGGGGTTRTAVTGGPGTVIHLSLSR